MDFFARIGRTTYGKLFMPILGTAISGSYMYTQLFAHDLIRDLLAAQTSSKQREEFSPELQRLVIDVYNDIKDDFNKPPFPPTSEVFRNKPGAIKWFSTSLMEPISFGCVESQRGTLIGLPNYYNYITERDIPDNIFEIKKFNLFKNFSKKEDINEIEPKAENLLRLDDHSELRAKYSESLILSENAKKFAIARELCKVDTYWAIFHFGIICSSFFISLALSRKSVIAFKLVEAHLSNRMPFYTLSGAAGLFNYRFLENQLREFYEAQCTNKAKNIGNLYEEGFNEFVSKQKHREEALEEINALDS